MYLAAGDNVAMCDVGVLIGGRVFRDGIVMGLSRAWGMCGAWLS